VSRLGAALAVVLALASAGPSLAQRGRTPPPAGPQLVEQVRTWRAEHEAEILRELVELLAVPNLSSDSVNIRRNASLLVAMLERRGLSARLLELEGAPPAVFGELRSPGAARTVVFYAHYDGQPVDRARWSRDPWRPALLDRAQRLGGREIPLPRRGERVDSESRLYSRSASDDKSPIVALLAALDALRALRMAPTVNLKVFLEGEEEAGSPHLRAVLERYAEALEADLWIFADCPVHQTGRAQLVLGARGVLGLEITLYGSLRPLHSGHYGNWAPNPAHQLALLVAALRDAEGRVTIPGFYDDVRAPTPIELAATAALPPVDSQLRWDLGLARTEASGATLPERILQPGLNVRGLEAGRVGELAANAIPTEARASVDFRLVPDQRPARVRELVERHLAAQGYHVVHAEPDHAARRSHPLIVRLEWEDGYPAYRVAPDDPAVLAVARGVAEATGSPPLVVPSSGGSLPLYHFREALGVPLVSVPIVNHDNNQHAADENLRIGNLWMGVEIFAVLLARLGGLWPPDSP
jgi:acetylornithine deacetylase/succinyl-diaminopimelate desuccinylase-like protein